MAINSNTPNLGAITDDLTTTGTSELRFRNAVINVAAQVDANQIDINLTRPITLMGDVSGGGSFNIGTGDTNADRGITITTSIDNMSVTRADIAADAIDSTKIADDAVMTEHLASGQITYEQVNPSNTQFIEVYDASSSTMPIYRGYVLVPTP